MTHEVIRGGLPSDFVSITMHLMLNEILPRVYRQLRKRTGLSQEHFGKMIGASKSMIQRYEKGTHQPKPQQLARVVALAKCSREELVEIFCEALSEVCGKRVGIFEGQDRYRPTSALSRANELLDKHEAKLPAAMIRALSNQKHETELLSLLMDRHVDGLKEQTRDCQLEVDQQRKRKHAAAP